ncbi:MAG: DUF1549 and DUF1553 domain-containing protein [Pirellulales bacterium]|nr:DUF1549 and DUF1553 domain-containing protein [Pirellulales bacterium]
MSHRTRRSAWSLFACATLGLTLSLAAAPSASAATNEPAAAAPLLEPIVLGTPERVEVFPANIQLATRRRTMHLAVTGYYAGGAVQDLTRAAEFISADESIARVESGVVRPVADGTTVIMVRVAGQQLSVPCQVTGQASADPVSFQYETLVALTKHGCNQGACHGSPSGKGGFRLSLRAYDPVLDAETLVREFYNRRTDMEQPDQSLLLRKPTMEVPHGGGRKLSRSDLSYQLLHDWILEGQQLDPADAAQCVKLEVYPAQRILHRPAHTQQVVALAHFSDGTVRDVTDLASFSSSDEAIASSDAHGLVVGHDRGEAAILVRYLDKMETATLMFLKEVPDFAWNNPAANNYVDENVFAKLQQMQILPSDLCSDEEFVRRVYLDVIGELPTADESRAFALDAAPDKRARLIDALLTRPEYAEFWALKWSDLLRVNNKKVTAAGVHKFRRWIVASLRDNQPYDQFVADLLLAEGSTFDNPAANYYRTAGDTNDCVETTSQLFLGIRIQCAKCHNHPFERWTQDNYYGIGAFFNRVQRKPATRADEQVVWVARAGEVTQPRTGKQMKPWLPLAGDADLPGEDDRRAAFVAWLRGPENPFFAQAEVNRLWAHLMGQGIVEPVDDFRASNPPSNTALLQALAQDFVTHGYDRKHILRTILNSRTYQLSARKNAFNANDAKYFSHAKTRLLSAEQLLDAICAVTAVDEKFPGLPAGTRATQLPSPDVDHYFLKVFGQPPREMACQCERSTESNLSQALQMINGPLVHEKLRHADNRFRKLAAAGKTDPEIVTELYQVALARQPNQAEIDAACKHVAAQPDRLQGLEDVCWAVLNAKEFLFQH